MTAPTPDPLALAVDIARERATFTPGAALLRAWSRRHPAVVQLGDVVQAIERCGASIALTDAVVLCGSLREAIHDALDQRDALAAALRAAHEENQRLREALVRTRAHTRLPRFPSRELAIGLLGTIARIVDRALTPTPEPPHA